MNTADYLIIGGSAAIIGIAGYFIYEKYYSQNKEINNYLKANDNELSNLLAYQSSQSKELSQQSEEINKQQQEISQLENRQPIELNVQAPQIPSANLSNIPTPTINYPQISMPQSTTPTQPTSTKQNTTITPIISKLKKPSSAQEKQEIEAERKKEIEKFISETKGIIGNILNTINNGIKNKEKEKSHYLLPPNEIDETISIPDTTF